MAVRRWKVRPVPETGVVDRQDLFDAVLDAVIMFDRAGGVVSLLGDRAATDLPGEMVTTLAIVEWKDRTDAKPQPEPVTGVVEPAIPQPGLFEPTGEPTAEDIEALDEPLSEDEEAAEAEVEEEDVSEIPAHMR